MSDDPVLQAVQKFMDAVETRIGKQDAEIRSLREELQTRAVESTIVKPLEEVIREEMARVEFRATPGKDGEPGTAGEKGDPGERGADGPPGKDGTSGERGADGINGRDGAPGEPGERGADGIATREELDSLIEARMADIQVRSFADLHRGTFVRGTEYARSDVVVWNGASWLAMEATDEAPGTSAKWRLLAKQGRDGRDAKREPIKPYIG